MVADSACIIWESIFPDFMAFIVDLGTSQMIELPDGSYLEIDCTYADEILVTHWVDGDPGQSLHLSCDS